MGISHIARTVLGLCTPANGPRSNSTEQIGKFSRPIRIYRLDIMTYKYAL